METNTNHYKNQAGKGLQADVRIKKIKVVIGDTEYEVERYKIVATWKQPIDPNKPTYAFTLSMIVRTLLQNGIQVSTPLEAVRIKVKSIINKCSEIKIYDNTPNNPFPILAWYQDGAWLQVEHPQAKEINNKK